jgi:paraquat-inducible protein A
MPRLPRINWALARKNWRALACLILNLAAFCCLIPGLVLPLLVVNVLFLDAVLLSQVRSIVGTVQYLHEEGADLPAVLIAIFSIAVPIVKFLMLIAIVLLPSYWWRSKIHMVVRDWSKWSMADVFVTAIFVAFLSANAKPTTMTASVGTGFYCFLSYCLLSLAALQVMPAPKVPVPSSSSPHAIEEHHPLHVITTSEMETHSAPNSPKGTIEMERRVSQAPRTQEHKRERSPAALPASHPRPAELPRTMRDDLDLEALVESDEEAAEDRRRAGGATRQQHQQLATSDLDDVNLLDAAPAGASTPNYDVLREQKQATPIGGTAAAAGSPRIEESF